VWPGLIALLLSPDPVAPRFELAWEAPAGCPDRAQVDAAIALQLERPPGRAEDPLVRAKVAIDEREGGWHAQLELVVDGTGGVRELQGESCETLAAAVVFVIAATIDPDITPRETDFSALPRADELWLEALDERLGRAPPRRASVALLPPRAVRPRDLQRRPRLRFGLSASGVLAIGPLPGVAGGVAAAFAFLPRRARIEIGATFLPAKTRHFDARPDAGGELRLLAADVRACPRWQWGGLGLDACAGVQVGAIHGRGIGIADPGTTRQPWLALLVGPRLSYAPIPRLAIGLGADLLVPIVRPAFSVENIGRLWRPLPAGFLGMLGIELRLP
jgi:hypothetical protein